MKSSTPSNVAASPLGVPLDLLTEQGTGSATVEILHSVTSDSPDGQPWPPTERNILWRLVRRADDCSYWRAIKLAESDPLPRTFAISLGQQSQLKGSQHEEG
jgi:hypothetical protein